MIVNHVQHDTTPGGGRGIYEKRHCRPAALVAVDREIEGWIVSPGFRAAEHGHRQQLENSDRQCPQIAGPPQAAHRTQLIHQKVKWRQYRSPDLNICETPRVHFVDEEIVPAHYLPR